MSLSVEARMRLAAAQAELVASLTSGASPPAGFDADRLHAAAAALARKRLRAAARAWSGLARDLGPRFREQFAAYAESVPLPRLGGPLADGRAFAHGLAARQPLPDSGRLQALSVDLQFRSTPAGLVPRRWPVLKLTRLSRQFLVALWTPWFGAFELRIPWSEFRPRSIRRQDGHSVESRLKPGLQRGA